MSGRSRRLVEDDDEDDYDEESNIPLGTILWRAAKLLGWLILLFLLILILVFVLERCHGHDKDGRKKNDQEKCDVIIVGVGAAGSAAAWRLVTNTTYKVCALEAGTDWLLDANPAFFVDNQIPANSGLLVRQRPDGLHGYMAVNEGPSPPYSHAIMGTGPGGGSEWNGMQVVHTTEINAQCMTNILGGSTWSFANQQAYVQMLENYKGFPTTNRGLNGPRSVEKTNSTVLGSHFAQAVTAVSGYPLNTQYNDGGPVIGPIDGWDLSTMNNFTRRAGGRTQFIEPILTKSNFKLWTKTHVNTILFDDNKTAIGVSYTGPDGKCGCMYGEKIFTSMNFEMSKLFERSGYGNPALLNSLGIKVVHPNPNVGEGMMQHWGTAVVISRPSSATGILDPNQLYAGGAFLPLPGLTHDQRDLQYILIDAGPNAAVMFILWNTRNVSGYSHISDASPTSNGQLNERPYVTDDAIDTVVMRRVIREQVVPIVQWMHDNVNPAYSLISPSPSVIADDAQLSAAIRNGAGQGYHYQGTVALGTCLDEKGRVHGVKNLYASGSAIMPFPCNNAGNLQSFSEVSGAIIADSVRDDLDAGI